MPRSFDSNQPSYAGFINGYIAGNLSANSTELQFHKEKIVTFLRDVKRDLNSWSITELAIKDLYEAISKSENIQFTNSLEYYLSLGENLHEIFSLIVNARQIKDLPSNVNFNLKKIIYHYLNIAQALKDRKISKKAKEIVSKFES